MPEAGAAYVFRRTNMTWVQEAFLKPADTVYGHEFGSSVALSADGSTVATA